MHKKLNVLEDLSLTPLTNYVQKKACTRAVSFLFYQAQLVILLATNLEQNGLAFDWLPFAVDSLDELGSAKQEEDDISKSKTCTVVY